MDVESVKSFSAERGDKGRVDIHHLIRESLTNLLIKNCHKSCINYKVSLFFL